MSSHNYFARISVNAEEHFRLSLFGLILDIIEGGRADGKEAEFLDHFGFLKSYTAHISRLWGTEHLPPANVWRRALEQWSSGHTLPLNRLADSVAGEAVIPAILMLAAVEEDPRFALLVEPQGGPPTIGGLTVFLADVMSGVPSGAIRGQLLDLAYLGIAKIGDRTVPRVEWTLRLVETVFDTLTGVRSRQDSFTIIEAEQLPSLQQWVAPAENCTTPQELGALLIQADRSNLIVRGDKHNGRKTLLRIAAGRVGMPVMQASASILSDPASWKEVNVLAMLSGALLVIEAEPGPGERVSIVDAPINAAHLAIVTSAGASIDFGSTSAAMLAISLPRPEAKARTAHWAGVGLAECSEQLSDRILTSGHIRRAAQSLPLSDGVDMVETVRSALKDSRDPRLEATAQRVILDGDLEDLFLDPDEQEEIDNLALRCRLREQLHDSSEAGVKALLSGPSGTGKTLAAKHLARMIERPLYRVDLAATVNKYIGETEKNLERALAAAEELDVILLLDEGDALLAKRTDVGSSNDRYANMETSFLLQRLEVFRGIILVTTNDSDRIDKAFRRRMDAIIPFHLPDQLRRLDILRSQLGMHRVSEALLDDIACRCALTGGQLHNVAVHARLLALADGCMIGDPQLVKAVQREFRKTGDHCPLRPALAKAN